MSANLWDMVGHFRQQMSTMFCLSPRFVTMLPDSPHPQGLVVLAVEFLGI
jgi:hypothetical protein